jgi:hypothetical protein
MYFSHCAGQVNNLFFCHSSVESQVRSDYYFFSPNIGWPEYLFTKTATPSPFFQNQMVVLSFRQFGACFTTGI